MSKKWLNKFLTNFEEHLSRTTLRKLPKSTLVNQIQHEMQEKVSVLHGGSTPASGSNTSFPSFHHLFPIQLTMIRGSKSFELPFELLPVLPESREVPLLVASR